MNRRWSTATQTGGDSGTQSHGSQPLLGKAEGQPGYRLTQCKPEEIPGRKATDPSPGNREGQPGYQTSARGGTLEQV